MSRKRRVREETDNDVSMTPMIDVVFQLLIYFLVTFSTPDVLARLDVSRPAPDRSQPAERTPPKMIRIGVEEAGWSLNGRPVDDAQLAAVLKRLAGISTNQTVLIRCNGKAEHARLVAALDLCAGNGLSQLSVVSAE